MKIHAVLFDLDGTVADSLDDIADTANRVFAARGLPTHDRDSYRRFVGEGVARLVARALPRDALGMAEEVIEDFKVDYAEHLLDRTTLYPGVRELVDRLADRGVPMAVLSNKPDWATEKMVNALFPDAPFTEVVGFREGVPRKPDPTSALALAERLGAAPAECAVVGDTATDIETALAAGMIPIGVLWGFRLREELAAAGAEHLIARPADLLDLLD